MATLRIILIGGFVGGIVLGAALVLLPDTPVYYALAVAAGMTAATSTWRPAGISMARHVAGCAVTFVLVFALTWGIERIL
jgi:hypothetical protein